MEPRTLEEICWGVVKEKVVGLPEKKKMSFKIRAEMEVKQEEEAKRKHEEIIEAEGLRDMLGWKYGERVKMMIKENHWRHIHRAIVSTHYPSVTQWNTCIEGNNVVYCLF